MREHKLTDFISTSSFQKSSAKTFLDAKREFDEKYKGKKFLEKSFVPVNGEYKKNIRIRNDNGEKLEEYYKWQFIYSLISSGLYAKDYIGVEVYFPKGNPKSKPLILDGAIFDNKDWIEYYRRVHKHKDYEALEWLREHLIGVIEFKREDGKSIEKYITQQLKPAMKESDREFVIGFYYDKGKVWIFKKKNNKILRYDNSKNQKGDKSTIKELSLELPDKYKLIPSFEDIVSKKDRGINQRDKMRLEDLDEISGVHSSEINTALYNILETMDKVNLVDQRGYKILIQMLAMKIFDEKASINDKERFLQFYITPEEKDWKDLGKEEVQKFIQRMKRLYEEAREMYPTLLEENHIDWLDEAHIRVIMSIVENLQDYSFVKSTKTDLYQLVFYRFASEFAKDKKGQFITPIPLIDFLVKIVNPRGNDTVIDPTVGIADFLSLSFVNSGGSLKDNNLYGLDIDPHMIMLAHLNMLLNGDGNAKLYTADALSHKINIKGEPFKLDIKWWHSQYGKYLKKGELEKVKWWDEIEVWPGKIRLKKFDVVLTNPPFGEERRIKPKNKHEEMLLEMYELWNIARVGNWIDPGILFLENAVRLLKENGRLGIVLSNSIASTDRWRKAREWLLDKVRIVAIFDLPPNVFADTGVNTTLIVAYKPEKEKLEELKKQDYEIFVKEIKKVGYEVRTKNRIKYYKPLYKRNPETFEIEVNEEGDPLLDEEFSETVKEFREWALTQEEDLIKLFLGRRE